MALIAATAAKQITRICSSWLQTAHPPLCAHRAIVAIHSTIIRGWILKENKITLSYFPKIIPTKKTKSVKALFRRRCSFVPRHFWPAICGVPGASSNCMLPRLLIWIRRAERYLPCGNKHKFWFPDKHLENVANLANWRLKNHFESLKFLAIKKPIASSMSSSCMIHWPHGICTWVLCVAL